jgi:hypothetical protein
MMKKRLKIYVESSVISAYHFAPKSIAAATRRFFEKAKNDVREKSLKVIEAFKAKIVPITNEAMDLASEYVKRGVIPARYHPDAEHIAVASVFGFDVLTSWNLSHIVRLKTKRLVRIINEEFSYPVPEIVRPDEI